MRGRGGGGGVVKVEMVSDAVRGMRLWHVGRKGRWLVMQVVEMRSSRYDSWYRGSGKVGWCLDLSRRKKSAIDTGRSRKNLSSPRHTCSLWPWCRQAGPGRRQGRKKARHYKYCSAEAMLTVHEATHLVRI